MSKTCLLSFFLIFLLCLQPGQLIMHAAAADDQSNAEEPVAELTEIEELEAKANALNENIKQLGDDLQRLSDEIRHTTGDSQEVLRYERQSKTLELLDKLFNLALNLREQQELGNDVVELRDIVVSYLVRASNGLDQFLDKEVELIESMRAEARELKGIDLVESERRVASNVAWLGELLEAKMHAITEMEHFEVSAENHRENLTNRLHAYASKLGGQLKLIQDEKQAIEIGSGSEALSAELKAQVRALNIRKKATLSSFSTSIELLGDLGVSTTKYRQTLLETGEMTTDLFNPAVVLGLAKKQFSEGITWLVDNSGTFITKLVIFFLILFGFRLFARFTNYMMRHSFESKKVEVSQLMQDMLLSLSSKGIMFLGVLVALGQLGFEITALLTGLGIAGFIVGFALQDSLANFVAGIMILGYRPYDVGDVIEAGGVMGRVSKMSLVSTTILTFDNQTLIVPNNKIWGDVIKNITLQHQRRIDLVFNVAFDSDIDHVKTTIHDVLQSFDEIMEDPTPTVEFDNMTAYSMVFAVRPWVAKNEYWPVRWRLLKAVKEALEKEGIQLPVVSAGVIAQP